MSANDRSPFALISLSDKAESVNFARGLVAAGYRILSTGGTAKYLMENGVVVTPVAEITGFPEIMGGRVKTLHPRIHGGLLGRRDVESDVLSMVEHGIADIRVVAVNLYPFSQTVEKGAAPAEIVEQIDIGGPAMIRAAAKNFQHVTTLVDPADYKGFLATLPAGPDLGARRGYAAKAFSHTADYDARIASWFDPTSTRDSFVDVASLRYGENPHQSARLVRRPHESPLGGWETLQGKELSYNNLIDADAALALVAEFDEPTCAIIKHTNPAGCASAATLHAAFDRALSCDSVSAFGGIVALNRSVDAHLAETLANSFWEVILAPHFSDEALSILGAKKNLRLLRRSGGPQLPTWTSRDTCFGRVIQAADPKIELDPARLNWATSKTSPELAESLVFAWRICKHVKSNAIVLASGTTAVGVGAGQMSRVDSVRIAFEKLQRAYPDGVEGPIVLASDAFFPFRDNIDVAAEGGVVAIIQPGGSRRDDEVIAACEEHGIAMALTGTRHFRH